MRIKYTDIPPPSLTKFSGHDIENPVKLLFGSPIVYKIFEDVHEKKNKIPCYVISMIGECSSLDSNDLRSLALHEKGREIAT